MVSSTSVALGAMPAPFTPVDTAINELEAADRYYWQSESKGGREQEPAVEEASTRRNQTKSKPCWKKCSKFDLVVLIELALQVAVYLTVFGFLIHVAHPYYEESFGEEYETVGQRLGEVLNSTDCLSSISSSKLSAIVTDLSLVAKKDREDRSAENSEIYIAVSVVVLSVGVLSGALIFVYYSWYKPMLSVLHDRGAQDTVGPGDLGPSFLRIFLVIGTMILTIVVVFVTAVANFEYGRTNEVAQQLLHGMFPDDVASHNFKSVSESDDHTIMLFATSGMIAAEIIYVLFASLKARKQHRNRRKHAKTMEEKIQAKADQQAALAQQRAQREMKMYEDQLRAAAALDQKRQREIAAMRAQKQALEAELHAKHIEIHQHKKEHAEKDEALRRHEVQRRVEKGKDRQVIQSAVKAKRSGGRHVDAADALALALETGYTDIEEVVTGTGVYSPKSNRSEHSGSMSRKSSSSSRRSSRKGISGGGNEG